MASSLRDNPLTPDLTAEQLRTRRGFAAVVAEGLARWAMFRHARDEIRRYLDSEPHRGAVWLLEDAVARREPPLLGERYDAFKDRAADLLAAAGWRVGYPVTDVPRLLAIAAERGRGAR